MGLAGCSFYFIYRQVICRVLLTLVMRIVCRGGGFIHHFNYQIRHLILHRHLSYFCSR